MVTVLAWVGGFCLGASGFVVLAATGAWLRDRTADRTLDPVLDRATVRTVFDQIVGPLEDERCTPSWPASVDRLLDSEGEAS